MRIFPPLALLDSVSKFDFYVRWYNQKAYPGLNLGLNPICDEIPVIITSIYVISVLLWRQLGTQSVYCA
jgi:hypothetical protein